MVYLVMLCVFSVAKFVGRVMKNEKPSVSMFLENISENFVPGLCLTSISPVASGWSGRNHFATFYLTNQLAEL